MIEPVLTALLSATFLAAVVSALTAVTMAARKTREEEKARVRAAYAEAFEAVAAYKELPYAIRRRSTGDPAAERARLSEEARHIQRKLSYYRAWNRGESAPVGEAYEKLVQQLRTTAGVACHNAWDNDPVTSDTAMNIDQSLVDLSSLAEYENQYIAAVERDLQHRTKKWTHGSNPARIPGKKPIS